MFTLPRLEINLAQNRIMGNDGCNDYSGVIKEISDSVLRFNPIASTEKMCIKKNVGDSYKKSLSKVTSYRLEGLNLILLDADGNEVLAFMKTD